MRPLTLLVLLLSSALFTVLASDFAYPQNLPSGCEHYIYDDTDTIICLTNRSTLSIFSLMVHPSKLVEIECFNFPKWSDFLLGSIIDVGVIPTLKFTGCEMPGKNFSESVVKQLSISGVENLELEKHMGGISKADLDVFPQLKNLLLGDTPLGLFMYTAPIDLLYGLPNLQQLDLSNTRLQIPAEGFFKNSQSLVSLDIEKNFLSDLPGNIFHELVNLEFVKLGFNGFTKLPAGLFSRNRLLKIVSLSHNHFNITRLPDGFLSGFTNLEIVSLENIGLQEIPRNLLWGSSSIIKLDLNSNYLTTLPANLLEDAHLLQKLNLSCNHLRVLPYRFFSSLRKLVTLDLSKNNLTIISENLFNGLNSLQELNLEHNNLKIIEFDALSSLVALKVAKFSHNQLNLRTKMYEIYGQLSPFYTCNELQELYLSHNDITEIYGDWIAIHTRLQKLDLSYNSLKYLMTDDLRFKSNELQVNLTHNTISTINLSDLESIAAKEKNLRKVIIDLNSNPIMCNCDLYSFLRYIDGRMEQTALNFITLQLQQLTCEGPEYYKGLKLLDFMKSPDLICAVEDDYSSSSDPCRDGVCDCWIRPSDETLIMDCSSRHLIEAPENIILGHANYVELDLSNNSLSWAPSLMNNGYEKVRSLNLANNQIRYVYESLISTNLKILRLHDNNLRYIDDSTLNSIINSNISLLTLHDNPWRCDCKGLSLLNLVQQMDRFLPQHDIVCYSTNRSFFSMTSFDLCSYPVYLIILSVFMFLGILITIYAIIYLNCAKQIKVYLYSRNVRLAKVAQKDLDQDKYLDAFVAYSHKDEDFVVQELMNNFYSNIKLDTLCLHDNSDIELAIDWIYPKILRGVEESKRTIIVLSSNFINSDWSYLVFRAAHDKSMTDKCARLIIIVYGDIDIMEIRDPTLRYYFQTNSLLRWGEPSFYQKLRNALPRTSELPKEIESSKLDRKNIDNRHGIEQLKV